MARRSWGFGVLAVLAVAIGFYALAFYGSPDGVRDQGFVTEKGSMPDLWYGFLWAHAVSAGTALAVGWLQFVKRIRLRAINVHRAIGYVYAAMNAIGAVTGLYLAYYANGGPVGRTGFATLSILWLYTLGSGLKSIVADRDPIAHGRWMLRNYALSCAAISLRIYTALAATLLGISDTNESFVVIAWLCWLPNLLFAEMLIGGKAQDRPG